MKSFESQDLLGISQSCKGNQNGFGVLIDAIKSQKSMKKAQKFSFIQFRIVDFSLMVQKSEEKASTSKFIILLFKTKDETLIPRSYQIGDIVRFERFVFGQDLK